MGTLKSKSIKALLAGIDDCEAISERKKGNHLNNFKSLYDEFLKARNKAERDKLIADFKKRNSEFSEFLENNPELVESEIKKSLLMATVGGEYNEEQVIVDSKGHKKISRTSKIALPDVSAARELLNMMGGSESVESNMAEAWINALLDEDENEQKK